VQTEKITLTLPGKATTVLDVEARPGEDDKDIALRLAARLPPGTIIGVSGVKWRVAAPDKVVEADAPVEAVGPQVGERWKPRDPRRKSGFTIRAVTDDDEVIAEDGRTIALSRFDRYEKIG
jgi:hypothetical protein